MGVDFQFGDIIENGYASYDNPTRVGVFIRYGSNPRGSVNAGRFIECRSANGSFWKTDLGNDRLKKIGSIFAHAALNHTSGEVTEAMLLTEMGKHLNWELDWGSLDPSDETSECGWRVYKVTGGRNDREWTLMGVGDTPAAALEAALRGEAS